jgi:hypothetical protein
MEVNVKRFKVLHLELSHLWLWHFLVFQSSSRRVSVRPFVLHDFLVLDGAIAR